MGIFAPFFPKYSFLISTLSKSTCYWCELRCHSIVGVTHMSLRCHSGAGAGVTKVSGVTTLSLFCHSGAGDGVTLVSGVTPMLVLVSLQCLVSLLCHSGAGPGVTLVHSGIRCHFIVGVSVLPVSHHQVLKIFEICYKLSMV